MRQIDFEILPRTQSHNSIKRRFQTRNASTYASFDHGICIDGPADTFFDMVKSIGHNEIAVVAHAVVQIVRVRFSSTNTIIRLTVLTATAKLPISPRS